MTTELSLRSLLLLNNAVIMRVQLGILKYVILLLTALTAPFLLEAAMRERQYFAIGGEWLLIVTIAVGGWALSGYIIKEATKHG